jgi:alpha-L-fucosidase
MNLSAQHEERYVPDPDPRIQKRIGEWQDLKFGLLMHWGPYSQWGIVESWSICPEDEGWCVPDTVKDYFRYKTRYENLGKTFNPVKFDPERWAKAASDAGMKYVVFTTKHHDGFCMFDTRLTDYRITAPDVPFHSNSKSNIVREVFKAFRDQNFAIGAYFSKADWHSPYYWNPDAPARTRNPNYETQANPERWQRFVEFTHGQIQELMTRYGPIDILWLDAGQVRPPTQDIQMDKLAEIARKHQPGLIIVDRTVGGRYENYRTPEQEVPEKPLSYTWETCMTMGDQWSFKPNDKYKSTHRLVHLLVDVVGKGGNFLLNVGPQPDGQLPEVALGRMQEMGAWLKVNGEAIYGTRPILPYKEGQVVFTCKNKRVYAIALADTEGAPPPAEVHFKGVQPKPGTAIRMLGSRKKLVWESNPSGATIVHIPPALREKAPCKHAYTLSFEPAG